VIGLAKHVRPVPLPVREMQQHVRVRLPTVRVPLPVRDTQRVLSVRLSQHEHQMGWDYDLEESGTQELLGYFS
jgi:hypothetical protein